MLEPVQIADLTQHERKPSNRVRVCRFHENKRELSYQWGSEEEIMTDEMNHSMIRLQIDDEHYVAYNTDDDYPNVTAMMFGIRAHGKCYAYHYESCDVDYNFPHALRQWWWNDAQLSQDVTNGEYISLDAFDQTHEEWESQRQGTTHARIRAPEYDMIQFIYKTIGFTQVEVSMPPLETPPETEAETSTTVGHYRQRRHRGPRRQRPTLEIFSLPRRRPLRTDEDDDDNNANQEQEQRDEEDAERNFLRNFDHQLMSIAPASINDILELIRNDILGEAGNSSGLNDDVPSFFTSTPTSTTPPPPPPMPSGATTTSRRRSQSPSPPLPPHQFQSNGNDDDSDIEFQEAHQVTR